MLIYNVWILPAKDVISKKRKERMNTNKDGEHSCINNNCGVKQSKGELNWNICFNLDTVITPWITKVHENVHLVGGFNHHEKYESMGRIIPYIMEKNMFETTNQSLFSGYPKSMNRLQEVHYREDGHLLR